jgi:hypothetical protein
MSGSRRIGVRSSADGINGPILDTLRPTLYLRLSALARRSLVVAPVVGNDRRQWNGKDIRARRVISTGIFRAGKTSSCHLGTGGHRKCPDLRPSRGARPGYHIREIFRIGTCRDDYSKPRDAGRILRGKDLAASANKCPELRAFLNTILMLSGAEPI